MRTIDAGELASRLGAWTDRDPVLYRALASAIEAVVREGQLPPGSRLPAERVLASRLTVSRGTVLSAYALLRDRGVVETLRGSGTVIRASASPVSGPREAHLAAALPHDSVLRGALPLEEGTIDLRGAHWVGTDALEAVALGDVVASVLARDDDHGYQVLGLPALRAAVAHYLDDRGLPTAPEQVLVTTGAQQGIALVVQLHVGVGDDVVVEDPTFPGAIEALVSQQATLHAVPVGRSGVDLSSLRAVVERFAPRLAYLIPSVHNPMGVSLPGPARQRLVELAAGWDTIILDDTTLADTRCDGPALPPLAAYADRVTAERIITVGSLSKVAWGGLRIGWVRAPERTIGRLARLKAIADLGTPVLSQLVAVELLRDPHALAHRRRDQLASRHDGLLDALRTRLPEWQVEPAGGGLCLWADLRGVDARAFVHTAAAHGVSIVPGSSLSVSGRFTTCVRLPFGQPEDTLRRAVDRLATAWSSHLDTLEGSRADNLSVVV